VQAQRTKKQVVAQCGSHEIERKSEVTREKHSDCMLLISTHKATSMDGSRRLLERALCATIDSTDQCD